MNFHEVPLKTLVEHFHSDSRAGLSQQAVRTLLEKYGPNAIADAGKHSIGQIILDQLKSPVVYLLLIAMAMSLFLNEWLDAIAIAVVILLNAVIGFIMEFQAEKSMQALQQLSSQSARLIRGGQVMEVDSKEIVPGDVLLLEAGDMVQADGRIITAAALQVDESALTGESMPVEKFEGLLPAETTLAERTNMVYKGTFTRNGNAQVLCTATGMDSELGHIANMVATATDTATPLEQKLEQFSKKLIWITVVIVVLIFGAGLLNNNPVLEMLKTAIALAVAAIPEGLPVVSTLALARGMMRMARQNVIVKKLAAVETLGATTVICTDKTGTLTENNMEVTNLLAEGVEWDSGKNGNTHHLAINRIKKVMVLCNNATMNDERGIGDPLEVSMLEFADEYGQDVEQTRSEYNRVAEIPFNSDTRVMCTLNQDGANFVSCAKGATESLWEYCSHIEIGEEIVAINDEHKAYWMNLTDSLAASGLKTLAFGFREMQEASDEYLSRLTFLGIAGFMDPPRKGVKEVIQECYHAGIRIIMLTGDHPATAATIAKELGIKQLGKEPVLTGAALGQDHLAWEHTNVFARVSPAEKLNLVNSLQEDHQVVAMTGDGVNDAPALKKADIGIAMGIRGTQVSQEVADMILKDDAFSSIVLAIKQGRIIYMNIRRFIIFLLSCNLSELLVIGSVALLNLPFQLAAIQILFINLVTDVFPAIAIGFTGGDENVMKRSPLDPRKPLISNKDWRRVWVYSLVIGAAAVAATYLAEHYRGGTPDIKAANNVLFYTLIVSQLLHSFNMTIGEEKFFKGPLMRNKMLKASILLSIGITFLCLWIPPVKEALRLAWIPLFDWGLVIACSLLSLIMIRLLKKLVFKNRQ